MKKYQLFQEGLLIVFMTIASGLLLNSCSKDDLILDQNVDNGVQVKTRGGSQWHWKCPKCHMLNLGWRNDCASCQKAYSPEHGGLVYNFIDCISNTIKFTTSMGGLDEDRIIELPGNLFPERAPEPWYENAVALKYYNELKTMQYYANPQYAEGVDFGWYRAVRSLYPRISIITQIEIVYDKWLIGPGRYLSGENGTGIKKGSEAAIKAFEAYR